jgi:hypothetical protein
MRSSSSAWRRPAARASRCGASENWAPSVPQGHARIARGASPGNVAAGNAQPLRHFCGNFQLGGHPFTNPRNLSNRPPRHCHFERSEESAVVFGNSNGHYFRIADHPGAIGNLHSFTSFRRAVILTLNEVKGKDLHLLFGLLLHCRQTGQNSVIKRDYSGCAS